MSKKSIASELKDILGVEVYRKAKENGLDDNTLMKWYHDLGRDYDVDGQEKLKDRLETLFEDENFNDFIELQDKVIASMKSEIEVRKDLKKGVIQDFVKGDIELDELENVEESL